MAIYKYSKQSPPQSAQELQRILDESVRNLSPLDEFTQIIRQLAQLEISYQMGSQEFYARFQRGEMGDEIEFVRWANQYEIYQEAKAELDHVFDILEQYALPVAA